MKTNTTQKMNLKKTAVYLIASTLLSTNLVHANDFANGAFNESCFSYPAVAMTPYDQSIHQRIYRMTHERVYHSGQTTGTILLYGPVTPWNNIYGDGFNFSVSYIDPDGKGKKSSVKAELRFVGAGGVQIISTLDSNNYAQSTNQVQTMFKSLPYSKLSKRKGFYVIRLYINRTSSKLKPQAFGYSLCSGIF